MGNDAIKDIVRLFVRVTKPSIGPVLDIDPQSYRHTRYLENKKYTVEHVSQVSEVEDPEQMYAAMICSYMIEQMDQSEQEELIGYIKEHVKPGGYVIVSMLIDEDDKKTEEGLRAEFGWHPVRSSKGKTISINTGDSHTCLDAILQKPEE